jgi:transposase
VKGYLTILDFSKKFSDEDLCLEFLWKRKRKTGDLCPHCGKPSIYHRVKKRKCYECNDCGYQIYPMKDTIFEKSRTPLSKWFMAIYLLSNSKNGVSAKEIERLLQVTYKTAWSMCHKIRSIMKDHGDLLHGIVEVDESQIGGKKNKNKFYIVGMVEREGRGRLVLTIVRDRPSGQELIPILKANISKVAKIYTDKYGAYVGLEKAGYCHKSINHKKSYAFKNGVSTNRIEGFWSLFKNSILGTHRRVSRKWLQHYLDEFSFRYNRRRERSFFYEILSNVGT